MTAAFIPRRGCAGKREYPPRGARPAVDAADLLRCGRMPRSLPAAAIRARHAMNAPLPIDRIAAAPKRPARAPRLREIPYNYTSFSDREIVIRLLGARAWEVLGLLRERAPHRPLGAHALRGARRHLGRPAQPLSAGRPARQPAPARPLIEALHHRLGEVEKRRTPAADAARDARRRRAAGAVARRGRGVRGAVPRRLGPAQAHRPRRSRASRPRTTSSSTACRASRTSPTRPTGASSIRSSC